MKKIILSIAVTVTFFTAQAQDTLYIHQKSGQVIKHFIGDVDSMTFTYNYACSTNGSVKDIEGNTYSTVSIGNQTWMAENLKTTKYANGDSIPYVASVAGWNSNTAYGNAICAYENNPTYAAIYGNLYKWATVTDSRGICPSGWHIPSKTEWETLVNHLGGPDVAGAKLKATGTNHWMGTNANASNESCFSALAAGHRNYPADFLGLKEYAVWWSSTENDASYAYRVYVDQSANWANVDWKYKGIGFSVRCIKD